MLHKLLTLLAPISSRQRIRYLFSDSIPVCFPACALLLVLAASACTPVHTGNVRQGIDGVKRGHTVVVRDSFANADLDNSGYLERREYPAFQQGPEMSRLIKLINEYNKTAGLLFDEADEDSDDRISLEEMLATVNSLVP